MATGGSRVIVASSDLMTASSFGATSGNGVIRAATLAAVTAAIETAADPCWLLVDLAAPPRGTIDDLPGLARLAGARGIEVVAFGPHVQRDLLQAARAWADRVLARGAAIRRFGPETGDPERQER